LNLQGGGKKSPPSLKINQRTVNIKYKIPSVVAKTLIALREWREKVSAQSIVPTRPMVSHQKNTDFFSNVEVCLVCQCPGVTHLRLTNGLQGCLFPDEGLT
jgi:hypothetical protein